MKINRPHIIVRKSLLLAWRWWHILSILSFIPIVYFAITFKWQIALAAILPLIPIISLIWRCIVLRNQYVEFYDSYVIKKRGVFHKTEEKCMFPKVMSCNVYRSFWGRIFNYGNVEVDAIGKWDIDLIGVKRPLYVRRYLENHFISAKEIRAMRQTVITQ